MKNRYESLIEEFETNIKRLVDERNSLRDENRMLNEKLGIREEDLRKAHKELFDLRDEYSLLETAQGIGGSDESRDKSREHLRKLVREIDKCIALLKE